MTGDPLYDAVLIGVFAAGGVAFLVLLIISAPYGRHGRAGWGPTLPTRLSWVLMELPSVVWFGWVFARGPHAGDLVPLLLLALWQAHYLHRTFVFPFTMRVRPGSQTALLVVLLGFAFNVANAYLNAAWISRYGSYTPSWLVDPRFVLGCVLFGLGYWLNRHSDQVLKKLREPGESGYRIPHGGGYRFVSSPNYLGELVQWSGWALASWSVAGVAFVFFTAANLVPRALSNHRWYKQTFPDYPAERRAIFPFLL